jgi:hypothetical protein
VGVGQVSGLRRSFYHPGNRLITGGFTDFRVEIAANRPADGCDPRNSVLDRISFARRFIKREDRRSSIP